MMVNIPKLLNRYTAMLWVGGSILTATVLLWDRRWIEQPIATLLLCSAFSCSGRCRYG